MSLTLIKEDGTGLVDANAYADADDCDAYHEGHLYATAWTGASAGTKDAALVMATRLIDALFQFNGVRTKATQALQWPREDCPDPDANPDSVGQRFVLSDVVPKAVADATCESAQRRHESRGLHYTLDYPDMEQKPVNTILTPANFIDN